MWVSLGEGMSSHPVKCSVMTLGKLVSLPDLLSVGKMLLTFHPDSFDNITNSKACKGQKGQISSANDLQMSSYVQIRVRGELRGWICP